MKSKIFILTLLVTAAISVGAKTSQVIPVVTPGSGGTIVSVSSSGLDITLQAVPEDGYKFLYWIDQNTQNPRTFTASQTEDVLVRAVFAKQSDIEPANGSVEVTVQDASVPSYTMLAQATAECGTFIKWSNGSMANPLTYLETMGTMTPSFSSERPDKVIFDYNQGAGGSIVGGTLLPGSCDTYTFTAAPESGYEFLYWSDGVTSAQRNFTYSGGDMLLRAVFGKTEDLHRDLGEVSSQLIDNNLPQYQLTATPVSCASFTQWNNASTSSTITYLETEGTRVPTFYSREMQHKNTDGEMGTIDVLPLTCGFTLSPRPFTEDYRFAYWNDNGSTVALRDVDYLEEDYTATFISNDVVATRGANTYTSLQDALDAGGDDPLYILSDATTQDMVVSAPTTVYGANHAIGNLTILCGADLTLADALVVNNLYLNTTTGSSSQLHNVANLTYTNAYVDIRLEATLSTASPNKWYAFGVPFPVDVKTGVARQSGTGSPLTNTKHYLIWEYDGQMRADNMSTGWKKMLAGQMTPGHFYMIGIDGNENTWRFKKADGALGGSSTLPILPYTSADYKHGGWNALANSTLTYAQASSAGITYAQVYDNASASGKYNVVQLSDMSFVLASPFFVQAGAAGTMMLKENASGTPFVQARRAAASSLSYQVTLSSTTQQDQLFLTASEEAMDTYEIGKDVLKIMGGSQDMYIWANAYGNRLCAQDALWDGQDICYPIGMYAPSAGVYTLSAQGNSDGDLYLMYNGITLTNLTESPYTVSLRKGDNNGYALMIRGQHQLPTILSPATGDSDQIFKTIQNAQLMIHVNDRIYNAQGGVIR